VFSYAQQNFASQAGQAAGITPQLIQSVVTIFAMGAIIAQTGLVLLIVILIFVAIQTILSIPQAKINADFSVKANDIKRPVSYIYRIVLQKESAAEMRSSLAGLKLLQNFKSALNSYTFEFRKYLRKLLKYTVPQGFLLPLQSAVTLLFIVIFVIDGDTSKIGLYASLTLAANALSSNVNAFFNIITQLFQLTMFGERIARFFETNSVIEPSTKNKISPPKGQCSIEFKDVSFGYENGTFEFKNFNLKIPAGGRIVIECGTHDELVAARGKHYEMFKRQAEYYQNIDIDPLTESIL